MFKVSRVTVWVTLALLLVTASCSFASSSSASSTRVEDARSFVIAKNRFVRDGVETIVRAGSLHYSRLRPSQWQDRLLRMKAMGLNAVQTYVPWNYHEQVYNVFNFEGDRDLIAFIKTVQSVDLMLVLRAGPYMCGEWEFGGFPAWLLSSSWNATLRTYEPNYIRAVDHWWGVLLPKVSPYLYSNGGPIIAVQVENEYGSYGDVSSNLADAAYLSHVISLARQHLGSNVVLFTTDGGNKDSMRRGSFNGSTVLTVGDFGPGTDVATAFAAADEFNPPGMQVRWCSEFYPGWLSHWRDPSMPDTSAVQAADTLKSILSLSGSVSIYMTYGGSNFNWFAGANSDGPTSYLPHTQTYDYSAPLAEGGGHNVAPDGDKFVALQQVFEGYFAFNATEPVLPKPEVYASVKMSDSVTVWEALDVLSEQTVRLDEKQSVRGMTMEEIGQAYGFIVYETNITVAPPSSSSSSSSTLTLTGVHDIAYLFVNNVFIGSLNRTSPSVLLPTSPSSLSQLFCIGCTLRILVEEMGRINYGYQLASDRKGLLNEASIQIDEVDWDIFQCEASIASRSSSSSSSRGTEGGATCVWTIYSMPLSNHALSMLPLHPIPSSSSASPFSSSSFLSSSPSPFSFYRGYLSIDGSDEDGMVVSDTYLSSRGWGKGYVWVNGFLLGRYWDFAGPQHSIYIPGELLRAGVNEWLVWELVRPSNTLTLEFRDSPDFDFQLDQQEIERTSALQHHG